MAIKGTGRTTFTKAEDYSTVFRLNGVRCEILNFDTVKGTERATFEADFLNGTEPCTVTRAVITCYAADGSVLGSPIEVNDTSAAVVDGGNLYLSKDCKSIACDAYLGSRKICSSAITVVRNGDKGDRGIQGLQGIQGPRGEQGIKGETGASGKTSYFHVKYSDMSNPTSASQMNETGGDYIGTYVDFTEADSTDPMKYTWVRTKGDKGDKGDKGIAGKNGADGRTSYLHIAYANSADGKTGFDVSDGTGKTYIGQYTDFTEADSTDPKKYTWTLIKGEKGDKGDRGDKGIAGTNGTDGTPATVYTIEPWGSISASGTLKDANTIMVTVKGNVKAYKTTGDRKEEYSSQPQSWRLSIGGTSYGGTATFNNNASNNIISFSMTQDYSISSTVPGSANIALFPDSSHSKQLASLIVPVSLNPGAIQDINTKLGTIQNTTTNMQNTVNGMHGTIETIRQGQGEINLKVQDLQNGGIDTGKPHTKSQVDFRTLDSNNFYPVMIFANDKEGLRRTVEISRPLDAAYGTGKSYMTHGDGFSFRLVFSDIGNKWGSFEAGQLRIESISQFWTAPSDTPICPRIEQYYPFSFMVAWLRGGSKYDISVDCADAYISGIWPYMMQIASNPSWVPDAVRIVPDTWTTEQVNAQGWNPYNLLKHDSGGFYADTDNEHFYRFGSITAGITLAIVGQPKDSKQWFVATWRITSVSGSKIYVDTSTYSILWQTQNPLGIRMNMLGYIKKGVSYSKSTWDSEKGFGTSESLDNTAVHANWAVSSSILVIGKESSATNGVYRDRAVLETVKACEEDSSVSFYSGTYFDVSPLYGTDGRRNVKPDLLATGIDIKSHKIVATADNFTVRNNSGDQTFSIDRDGNIAGSGNASFRGKVYASGGEFTGTVTAAKIYGAYINGGAITGTIVTGSSFTSTSADGKSVTKITGGQLTTGTTNKLIIDTPGNEPGGVLRITQGGDDFVKLGVTDTTGKAYADIKGAWKNEKIARNVCAGPYLMLGRWVGQGPGEDPNTFSFLSRNFMYVKHIDAEFLETGGIRMIPVTLTDIDFVNFRGLKDIDEVYMSFSGRSQYNHPSELYFWNSSEITFDLGDPAEHDDRGLVKNAGRILFIWQMGARIIFKGTPNPTSGNTAACMYLGRKIRGETSIDSDCLGQLNILMSDGKHWVMHYMND